MSAFLTAEWRKLIMAQYEVSPDTLAPWLPPGVELDLFHSRCYVSLVGFLFDHVRIKRLPIPFHTRFEEINLRFYVKRTEPDGSVKRGVVFIREFVPRLAISIVANALYEEPYATLPTRHKFDVASESLSIRYDWRHKQIWHSIAIEADPTPEPIPTNSEAEFITEHYWGYTKRRNGTTSAYEVAHPRWQVYPIRNFRIAVDFGMLYGPAFAHLVAAKSASVILAEGSAVSVDSGTRLRPYAPQSV
jgi:uncharacterized protein YqjF (DUF2071 family)